MSLTEISTCVVSGQFAWTLTVGNQGLKKEGPNKRFDRAGETEE